MKKLLLLCATAMSLTFAGCLKSNNGQWEEYQKVGPGIEIYQYTTTSFNIAMMQSYYGMRLAVLLEEAHKQNITNLDDVEVEVNKAKVKVKNKLFGSNVKIEKQDNGDYKLTFTTSGSGTGGHEGVMLVAMGGVGLLSETDHMKTWSVTFSGEFLVKSNTSNGMQVIKMQGGETILYAGSEDADYIVMPRSIRYELEGGKFVADWSGKGTTSNEYTGSGFKLVAPKEGLAYSDSRGKFFTLTGAVGGPSVTSFNGGTSAADLTFEALKCKFLGSNLFDGTVNCKIGGTPGYDFDTAYFPSGEVSIVYTLNEETNKSTSKVYYNGFEY